MLSFVVCDDNKAILDRLVKMLESLFIKHHFDAEVSFASTDAISTLQYVENNTVNALFLDIDLKSKISGLDLAEKIRKNNKQVYIVFTSAHLEYILKAYQYKTFDFMPKPITVERLEDTVLRMMDDMGSNDNKSHFIRLNNRNTIINENSVNFIKKDGMKLVFYTDNRIYETYSSFNKISEELPSNFVRCHKSYIANINKITDVSPTKNTIIFDNESGLKCFIGPKYKNKIMEVLKNDGDVTNNLDGVEYGEWIFD